MTGTERMTWMDALRGTSVFLVILTHAVTLSPVGAPWPLEVFVRAIAPFRVPALMFLSGMLLPRSLARPRSVYLRGKVSRILWPYLVWSGITLVVTSFGTPGPSPLIELFVNPKSAMWYVGYLFVFYVVTMFFRPAGRSWLLLGAVAGLALSRLADVAHPLLVGDTTVPQRWFFTCSCFLAGDLLMRHRERWLPALTSVPASLTCAVLALPALVLAGTGWTVRYEPLYLMSTLAGIVAAVPFFRWLAGRALGRSAASIGQSSIVFYVTHWPVQLVAYHAAAALGMSHGLVVTAWNLAAALGVGFGVRWLRSRWDGVDYLFDLHLERSGEDGPRPLRRVAEAARRVTAATRGS
ncbi:MAG: acyltransferase family protein [Janthinobacterium lividum]